MERFKLFIKRFADEDIRMTVGISAASNTKSEAMKVVSSLEQIEQSAVSTMGALREISSKGTGGLKDLKNAVKDLVKQSEDLSKIMSSVGAKGSPGFNTKANKLTGDSAKKEVKMGFTGGASDDPSQLLKEAIYLYDNIFAKTKLIRQEEEAQVKTAEQMITQLEKENALKGQQSGQNQAKVDFQQSFTNIGNNAEVTAQYREQYNALMALLTPEQQDLVIKRLMNEENKKLVNSTLEQIQAYKDSAMNSTRSVSAMDKLRNAVNRLNVSSEEGKKKFKKFIDEVKSVAVTWRIIGGVLRSMVSTFANLYDSAASYEEALNLYTVALGEYAQQATQWANRISEALYLDPKAIMQYTGAFYNLVQGLGASSDAAYLMSTNLTQLSYDMSSYLNIDVESAQAKIQSAITGQSRAVASAGIAMQQATLQELAYSLGIKKSVSEMTQAEKTYLRYIQIMRSTKNMQGDLARTLITPENALRVIRTQFVLLGRAIGQVFIPIVLKVIPYIMLLVQALQRLAAWLGKKLGYEIADIDYSSLSTADTYMENLGNTAGDTAKKVKGAASSISRSLAPFDNLNVVESEGSGGGGGVGAGLGGGGSIIDDLTPFLEGYDMLAGLTDKFNKELEKAKENLKKWLPLIITIGALFLGWKLAKDFMNAIIFVDNFLKAWSTIKEIGIFAKIGSFLMGIPMIGEAVASIQLIGSAIGEMAAGTMTLSEGFSFIGSALGPIAAAIGGVLATIAGIFKFVEGIKDILNGKTFKGIIKVIEGIALVVAGIALLFGGWIVAAVAAVVAVVAAVVEHWDAVKQFFINLWEGVKNGFVAAWNAIVEFFTPAIEWIGEVCASIGQFFVDLWNGIVDIAVTIADWFNDNVIQPIINFFTPIVAWFKELFTSIWNTVSTIWYDIKVIIVGVWTIVKEVWSRAFDWFKDHVLTPIGNFFKKIWEGIKEAATKTWEGIKKVWEVVSTWFRDKIITPVADFFKNMWNNLVDGAKKAWEGVKKAFSTVATFFKDTFTKAWTKVKEVFSTMGTIFKGIAEGIFKVFATVVNKIIAGINKVVSIPFEGINKALGKLRDLELFDKHPFGFLKDIPIPQIPEISGYAQGGYPTSGDLFYANENGRAEYITSVGHNTAVANQDQMISAITNAILVGMQSIQTDRGITQVYIGNEKVYEGQGQYQNRQADRWGTNYIKI